MPAVGVGQMGACNSKPPVITIMEDEASPEEVRVLPSDLPEPQQQLVDRVLQLEQENARLREHLQLLAGLQASGIEPAPVASAKSGRPLPLLTEGAEDYHAPSPARLSQSGSSKASPDMERRSVRASDREAEAEAEAADLACSWVISIDPEPRDGCTVIQVQAPERESLLTDISRILNGLGLAIRDAVISKQDFSGDGNVEVEVDEFWVQESADDGSGAMQPARDLQAIEKVRAPLAARAPFSPSAPAWRARSATYRQCAPSLAASAAVERGAAERAAAHPPADAGRHEAGAASH